MSSRFLAVLFTAPLVGLAVLAFTSRPVPTGPAVPAVPTVGVWRVVCPPNRDGWQGPYSNPDDCRTAIHLAQRVCRRPLVAPNHPDPTFVRYAETCRDAYDATACHCDYLVVAARYPTPTEVLFPATAQ
jgi:hypothetical protein